MTESAHSLEATETPQSRQEPPDQQPASSGSAGGRGWGSSRIAGATAIVTLTVLAIAVALAFLFEIRTILLWLLVGLILAVSLEPAVAWLQRHGWNRVLASLLVSIATIALLVGAVLAVAYPLVFQSDRFVNDLPRLLTDLFGPGGSLHFLETRFHIVRHVSSIRSEDVANLVLGGRAQVMSLLSRAASSAGAVVTILTMMMMLLIEGPRAWRAVLGALIEDERRWVEHMGVNFLRSTGGYVRGNVAISVVAGTAAYIVLRILGIPYAETLAVFVAVFDIIPMVGATIAAVVVCIIGLATGGAGGLHRAGRVLHRLPAVREQRAAEPRVQQDTGTEPVGHLHRRAHRRDARRVGRRAARDPTRRRRLGAGRRSGSSASRT